MISLSDSPTYLRYWCSNPTTRLAIQVEDVIQEVDRIAGRRKYMRSALVAVAERLEEIKYELLNRAVKE
jgi:hypothetical protein